MRRTAPDSQNHQLHVYTDEETAVIKAVDRFRVRHRRLPTDSEAFALLLCLGYRLVAPPMGLPKRTR